MKKCYQEMAVNVFDFDHIVRMAQEVKPCADLGWISGKQNNKYSTPVLCEPADIAISLSLSLSARVVQEVCRSKKTHLLISSCVID